MVFLRFCVVFLRFRLVFRRFCMVVYGFLAGVGLDGCQFGVVTFGAV